MPHTPAPLTLAFTLANEAFSLGEVPVGAVITHNGDIIASAKNAMRVTKDPTAHAEVLAIRAACQALGQERLTDCDLYVTLEPCTLCAAAISFARIRRLYYAASDEKTGAVQNGVKFFDSPSCHHCPEVYDGLRAAEAEALLKRFFAGRR